MNWLGAYRYIHIGEHVHTGGTANCHSPAICEDCGRPYGDKNPNYHHDVEKLTLKMPLVPSRATLNIGVVQRVESVIAMWH